MSPRAMLVSRAGCFGWASSDQFLHRYEGMQEQTKSGLGSLCSGGQRQDVNISTSNDLISARDMQYCYYIAHAVQMADAEDPAVWHTPGVSPPSQKRIKSLDHRRGGTHGGRI